MYIGVGSLVMPQLCVSSLDLFRGRELCSSKGDQDEYNNGDLPTQL